MKTHIGIDLGKNGGIAWHTPEKVELRVMPLIGGEVDYHAVSELLASFNGNAHVVFERLQATPMVPKHTCISMGWQAGAIEGMCVAHKIPYTMLSPKTWQKEMFLGVPDMKKADGKNDTKGRALISVRRLYPGESFLMTARSSVPHNGVVDALLMARYAQKINL